MLGGDFGHGAHYHVGCATRRPRHDQRDGLSRERLSISHRGKQACRSYKYNR